MAQQYYTITEDGIYGQRQYYAGDQIPMEWAVEWGLDGATLPDPPSPFSAAQQAAIQALVAAGGGGGETFPMNPGVWYDNSTVMAGGEGDDPATIDADTITGALIRVTDPDASLTGVGFMLQQSQSGDETARFTLYAVSETGTSRGLAGAKVADLGTVLVTDGSLAGDPFELTPDAAVTPGYYWLCASATGTVSIGGFRATGGMIGRADFTDGSSVNAAGFTVASTGAHTAMPSTLEGVVAPDDLTQETMRVFFQVTPN